MSESNLVAGNKGTYAKLVPSKETQQKIASMLDLLNVENHVSANDLHVTVVHSTTECPTVNKIEIPMPIKAQGITFDLFPNKDGTKCLVLKLDSPDMHELHGQCRDSGASHDFPTYNPHITLSYDYTFHKLPSESWLEYFSHLVFDEFIIEPLNLDWRPI